MTERIVIKGQNGRRMRIAVVRARRVRRAKIARRMARAGWPAFAIMGALRMSRHAVDLALGGNEVFDARMLQAFRESGL